MMRVFDLMGALTAGQPCSFKDSAFLGLPHWYQYLPGIGVSTNPSDPHAAVACNPQLNGLNDIWLIVAAVIEILLRLAAMIAVIMVIYGGVKFITSQGEPEATTQARNTIINALIGLLLAVMAAVFVSFVAGRIS